MKARILSSLLCSTILCFPLTLLAQETLDTRIGPLSFTHDFASGYPTDETIAKLFDEIDFQRASQAYIWSIPLVSMAQWQFAWTDTLGAENGQIVFLNGYDEILGGLTFNATTQQRPMRWCSLT